VFNYFCVNFGSIKCNYFHVCSFRPINYIVCSILGTFIIYFYGTFHTSRFNGPSLVTIELKAKRKFRSELRCCSYIQTHKNVLRTHIFYHIYFRIIHILSAGRTDSVERLGRPSKRRQQVFSKCRQHLRVPTPRFIVYL
jgi:hypothetical protein